MLVEGIIFACDGRQIQTNESRKMQQRQRTEMSAGIWRSSSAEMYPGGLFEQVMKIDLLQTEEQSR